eukprot:scaffold90634_cov33-Tisochrysis_lutea.AAC.3
MAACSFEKLLLLLRGCRRNQGALTFSSMRCASNLCTSGSHGQATTSNYFSSVHAAERVFARPWPSGA